MGKEQAKREAKWFDAPVSQFIREQLRKKGIKAETFADHLGVSGEAVRQWCSGYARPDIDKLVSIAQYFGVSTDYLLGATDCPSPSMDVRAICEKTGLSTEALESFIAVHKESKNKSDAINAFIAHEHFIGLARTLKTLSHASKGEMESFRYRELLKLLGRYSLYEYLMQQSITLCRTIFEDITPRPPFETRKMTDGEIYEFYGITPEDEAKVSEYLRKQKLEQSEESNNGKHNEAGG